MAFDKSIKEKGLIISKEHKEAKEERTGLDGRVYPATEEKYIIEVISCDEEEFDKKLGIKNGTRIYYEVDKATFDKAEFGMWANVKFKALQFGDKAVSYKGIALSLIEK